MAEVFKHKYECVALWKLVAGQLTSHPGSVPTLVGTCPPIRSGAFGVPWGLVPCPAKTMEPGLVGLSSWAEGTHGDRMEPRVEWQAWISP